MPEPLIHFIIPLFLLIMLGLNLKKSILISSLATIPDLDVIFGIHRSFSHSVIFILILGIALIFVLNYLKIGKNEKLLIMLVLLSHPFLDMFGGNTPIMWPIFDKSVYIFTELTTNLNNVSDLNLIFDIRLEKTVFYRVSGDGPIFTGEGFGMTLVLLTGLLLRNISVKYNGIANIVRYGVVIMERRLKR